MVPTVIHLVGSGIKTLKKIKKFTTFPLVSFTQMSLTPFCQTYLIQSLKKILSNRLVMKFAVRTSCVELLRKVPEKVQMRICLGKNEKSQSNG